MSKEKETTQVTSKYKIVELIAKLLKQDDASLLEKFYDKQVRNFERNIKVLKQNKVAAASNYDVYKSEIEEKVEDAEGYLKDAYLAVKIEDIKNNAQMDVFEANYWSNIKLREEELKELKDYLNEDKSDYDDEIEAIDSEIKHYEERIKLIKEFSK